MSAVGTPVHLTGLFLDDVGQPADPTTVNVTVTLPDLTTVTHTGVHDDVGLYHYDYTPTVVGQHQFYWIGTTPNLLVPPDVFTVDPLVTSALVSLDEVKAQLRKTGNGDDDELRGFIQTATEIVNNQCGYTSPTVYTETATVSLNGEGHQVLALSRTPVLSVASVTPRMVGMPTVDLATLNINSESGIIYLGNWYRWFGPQLVTYTAGLSAVPPVLKTAALLIVKWLWDTKRGGATATPNQGGNETVMVDGQELPARAAMLMELSPYNAAPGIA